MIARKNWSSRIIKLCLLAVGAAALSISLRPNSTLVNPPLFDDSFLAFTIARNLGLGSGITIDGRILTNGFQPLFTLLTAPLFSFAADDRYLAIRYVLALQWLVYLGTGLLVGAITRDLIGERKRLPIWLPMLVYLSLPLSFTQHFNGLETGFLLFMYALVAYFVQTHSLESLRDNAVLGVLLGLLVLTRIDSVFFVVIFSLVRLVRGRGRGLPRAAVASLLPAALAAVVSLPWWLYNVVAFGDLMPSSGRSQESWALSLDRIAAGLSSLVQLATPVLYTGRFTGLAVDALRLVFLAIMTVWLIRIMNRVPVAAADSRRDARARTGEWAASVLLSTGVLFAYYVSASMATYFYTRYLSPILLLSAIGLSIVALDIFRRHSLTAAVLPVALTIPILATTVLRQTSQVFLDNVHYHEQYALIQRYVPADEAVGAFQSGVIGYFRRNAVNLDGKVNPEALSFRSDIDGYMRQRAIRWFSDWGPPPGEGWQVVARLGRFALYHRP